MFIITCLSASSRIMILCFPFGRVTFCWANILILLRTTSIPRSFEAFSSITASLKVGPRRARAKHRMVVVLPTPGGPWKEETFFSQSYDISVRDESNTLHTYEKWACGYYCKIEHTVLLLALRNTLNCYASLMGR